MMELSERYVEWSRQGGRSSVKPSNGRCAHIRIDIVAGAGIDTAYRIGNGTNVGIGDGIGADASSIGIGLLSI